MSTDATDRPKQHIEIPGDILLPDQEFCDVVLNGATTRTARRLEAEGLPYTLIRGRKFRPLREGQAWLAARIQRRNQPPKHKKTA